MKFCSRPFEYFYIDNYRGDVSLCPWMKHENLFIGRLENEDAVDIWNGENAERFRKKFRQGDLSSCRLEACPYLQNNSLPDVDPEVAAVYPVAETPKVVNMAFDFMCNQYCETCRPDKFRPILPRYRNYMQRIHEQILPYLYKARQITASGHGDPFASPYMMKILEELKPVDPELKILLETNGVHCDARHWERIKHLKDFFIDLVVTINSYNPFVYEHISRGGNLEKLLESLKFIKELRKRGDINHLSIAFVIQDRNFRELPEFIARSLDEFEADQVVLKPVYQWGTMPDDVFWFKDVLNPMHPYHEEYLEILEMPIMNSDKVMNFGGKTLHPATPFPGHCSKNI